MEFGTKHHKARIDYLEAVIKEYQRNLKFHKFKLEQLEAIKQDGNKKTDKD